MLEGQSVGVDGDTTAGGWYIMNDSLVYKVL